MIRFLADEDIKHQIYAGIRRRLPELDIVRVQDVGLRTFRDERVLEFAAQENRILLTHDVSTMRTHAIARLTAGKPMVGVFEIPQGMRIGRAVDEIVMIAECSRDDEWIGVIQFLPL
jgi:predicted nuclease of predicted toxin-antitoxin system